MQDVREAGKTWWDTLQLQRRRNTRVLRDGNERFLAVNCNLTSSYSVTRRKKGYFVRHFFSFIERDDLRTKKSLISSGKWKRKLEMRSAMGGTFWEHDSSWDNDNEQSNLVEFKFFKCKPQVNGISNVQEMKLKYNKLTHDGILQTLCSGGQSLRSMMIRDWTEQIRT